MNGLRIRIVGGSLAGLFAAILLEADGHDVRIYERSASGLAGRGAGLVGQQDLFRLLRRIGCEHLARVGVVAFERIYFERDGSIAASNKSPQTQISWDHLFSSVAARLAPERYILGRPVTAVSEHDDHALLHFADGSEEAADLVIGADGLGSVVRGAVNAEVANGFAGYAAWRGLIPETALPRAAQILVDRFAFYLAPGIHVLGYLVPGASGEIEPGSRRYNWVWYRPAAEADLPALFAGRDGHSGAFSLARGAMTEARRDRLHADAAALLPPPFAAAIEAEQTPSIQGIFDYEAQRMASRRVALVGDAAFVVRPHTAMGVAKAAGDVLALQRHLQHAANLGAALAAYEGERLPVGREIAAYGRALGANAL